ncbi:sialidase family protein [Nocardioides sp.]|uniref:sialidase family protein n=1 Tax=Nocardioides sp. TaxID=35761 RepID=UPI00261F7A69|nr:sialidase family protein [Nocardioides sp.]
MSQSPAFPSPTRQRRRTAVTAAGIGALALAAITSTVAAPAHADVTPFPTTTTPTSAPGSYTSTLLASNGDNALDATLGKYYRIVALANVGNGVVLAAYDGRPNGGDSPAPNSIIQRRSTDNGATWGPPTYIARGQVAGTSGTDGLAYGFSDPSYVVDHQTGTVFNFHVYSKDQGFNGSALGNDDTNRQVISTEVSVSTDGGLTWSTDPTRQPALPTPTSYAAGSTYAGFAGPLITSTVKPVGSTVNGVANVGGVYGEFATSGEGIQLQYGAHAGRLIQQFAGTIVQPSGSTAIQAYSVYSDDHGASWQMGTPVGTGMDENKVVELSDGTVMLNVRDHAGSGYRKVARSTDGGQTWGAVTSDTTLIDPTNNAGITRMYPDAAQGSVDAKKLLFSNAASTSSRVNGTVRYSCDDGTTWSTSRQFKSGAMSYSTLTALDDGTFGLLYEGDSNAITFAKFDAAWLSPVCATATASAVSLANGGTGTVSVTVTNKDSVTLAAGTVALGEKLDWSAPSVAVPALAPGASTTVSLSLTSPSYLKAGTVSVPFTYTTGTSTIAMTSTATVTGGATSSIVGARIFGQRYDSGVNLATSPYAAGSTVPYAFRVYSAGNIAEAVVPVSGNLSPFVPSGTGNCRYLSLAVGADYLCATPKHTVTADEVAQGFFVPSTVWQVTGTGATTQNYTITGDEVDLLVRKPALTLAIPAGTVTDVDGDGYASVGDTVTYTVTVKNTGNVTVTGLAGVAGLSTTTLAAGASTTATVVHTLTASEISAGKADTFRVVATAANGTKAVSEGYTAAPVTLTVQ